MAQKLKRVVLADARQKQKPAQEHSRQTSTQHACTYITQTQSTTLHVHRPVACWQVSVSEVPNQVAPRLASFKMQVKSVFFFFFFLRKVIHIGLSGQNPELRTQHTD